jgi:C-methyltransferase
MAPIIAPQAEALAHRIEPSFTSRRAALLDIASGHGLYGVALARRFPKAQVVLQDWASVLPVAEENAARAGVRSRVTLLPGDARTLDLGGPTTSRWW